MFIDKIIKYLLMLFLTYMEVNLQLKSILANTSVYKAKVLWNNLIEKELSKVDAQLESLQAKKKDLEEQKRMAERAEKLDIIEKHKISSEKLQLLIKFSEDEILQLLAQKEKERTGNEEKVIS